ncbi:MAG: protein-L-isoaspartate(D-aspartate) O-methyltransferase [Candidatus Hydrogenedentes bacterium]|nr:protein-L-isoaspartate(D-aspartate) O-methyltransferase [Candidatus Hydrogenedentota bacterium]
MNPKESASQDIYFDEKTETAFAEKRRLMVKEQLIERGIKDERVLEAMTVTPRHRFVSLEKSAESYADHPLIIDCGQTISQPYMVAAMTELLQLNPRAVVLEIGTGSGYQTAILARLAARVISIERHAALAEQARERLLQLGYDNIQIVVGDGSVGFPEAGDYDGILVTAGAPSIPVALQDQLAEGGRLVIPVGDERLQTLITVTKKGGEYIRDRGMTCRFVPLVGQEGWKSPF